MLYWMEGFVLSQEIVDKRGIVLLRGKTYLGYLYEVLLKYAILN